MQEGKVCCFSGHRILRHSEQAIRAALDRQVAHMAQNGYTGFISGAASGFDLLAAEAVLDYKRSRGGVVLKLFVPYADFFDGWSADARRRRLIALESIDVEIVCREASRYAPLARDRRMVEESDACVCYMISGSTSGGTYYTVALARQKGIDIVNLAPLLNAVSKQKNNRF